jgi:hypothetical protein
VQVVGGALSKVVGLDQYIMMCYRGGQFQVTDGEVTGVVGICDQPRDYVSKEPMLPEYRLHCAIWVWEEIDFSHTVLSRVAGADGACGSNSAILVGRS